MMNIKITAHCRKTMCKVHIRRFPVRKFVEKHVIFKLCKPEGEHIKFCHDCYRKIETCNDWLVQIERFKPSDFDYIFVEKYLDTDTRQAWVNNAVSLGLERSCVETHMHALQTSAQAYRRWTAELRDVEDAINSASSTPSTGIPRQTSAEARFELPENWSAMRDTDVTELLPVNPSPAVCLAVFARMRFA